MKEFIEKLIGRLEYLQKDKYVLAPTVCYVLEGVKQYVNQLAEEYNNGWIPCSERLPDKKGTYLVTVEKFGVTFARFTGQKDNLHFDANVIAWQSLPAPYQLKGE